MYVRRFARLASLAVAVGMAGCAARQPVFVDVGACPGEGCVYGERWTARAVVSLRAAPEQSAAAVGRLQPGESVETLTGEVHTAPGRFVVRRTYGEFAPGDEILVYTYLGEGVFRVRHNGILKEADLEFSPWGGSGGNRCQDEARCWGTLDRALRFTWWVKVRSASGTEGWVSESAALFATP